MEDTSLEPFLKPKRHVEASRILRRHSTNPVDVRAFFLEQVDLSSVRRVLDLGCGFGFMVGPLAERIAPDAEIVGVDACESNREPYLTRVLDADRRGVFLCESLDRKLDWRDTSFDLVVASYSLYFFPNVLPEIPRILRPNGMLLAITHTATSCRDMLRGIDWAVEDSELLRIVRRFCAENGEETLSPYFGHIERHDYVNTLVFEATSPDDLVEYLGFKRSLLLPTGAPADLCAAFVDTALTTLRTGGRIVMEKNDAGFVCRKPQCH